MSTSHAALSETEYVLISSSRSSVILQSLRDEVKIVLSDVKPAVDNIVHHTLSGSDSPLFIPSPDTNIWAIARTNRHYLVITELSRQSVDSMMVDVARGNVPGAKPIGSYGKRTTTGPETNRVIWPNGVFTIPPSAGVQMSIVSTSANDAAAGSNVRQVEVHYLDGSLNEQSEIVTLNGLTPVLTVATDIRFINCIHTHTYGTTPYAAGNITASNGGTTYGEIGQGELRCTSSARMIPAGYRCFVAGAVGGSVSGTAAAGVFMQIVATELDTNQYVDPMILFPHGGIGLQDVSVAFNFPVPLKFSAGSVVALSLTTDKAAIVGGSWFGWLESI